MLQPLDVGVFGPFQSAWLKRCEEVVEETNESISWWDFPREYYAIRLKTFTPEVIQAAFRKTGISPFDPGIFSDEDFAPSLPTSGQMELPAGYPEGSDSDSASESSTSDTEYTAGSDPDRDSDDSSESDGPHTDSTTDTSDSESGGHASAQPRLPDSLLHDNHDTHNSMIHAPHDEASSTVTSATAPMLSVPKSDSVGSTHRRKRSASAASLADSTTTESAKRQHATRQTTSAFTPTPIDKRWSLSRQLDTALANYDGLSRAFQELYAQKQAAEPNQRTRLTPLVTRGK